MCACLHAVGDCTHSKGCVHTYANSRGCAYTHMSTHTKAHASIDPAMIPPYCHPFPIARWLFLAACVQGAGAYGFAHCSLSFEQPDYASCMGRGIVQLSQAIASLPNTTKWINASQNALQVLNFSTFTHLPHLQELRLDQNQLDTLHPGAFQGLAELKRLDLSQNRLVSLEPAVLAGLTALQVLHLGHNTLATLHPESLALLGSLQELHLAYNQLSQLQDVAMAMQGLANLSLLDLDSNQISSPCRNSSPVSLPFLKSLNLRSNNIVSLDLTHCSLPSLQKLNLTRNNMTQLVASSFYTAPSLEELTVDENHLNISQLLGLSLPNLTALHFSSMRPALESDVGMACQVLQGLPALKVLDIKHSKILSSQVAWLGSCTNLTQLDLATTPLSHKDKINFHTFHSLEFLSLDKCKIQQFSGSQWGEGLAQLHTLILRRNLLTKLVNGLFKALPNLTFLDLSRNRLTYVYKKNFLGMASLRTLLLQGCQLASVTRNTFVYARKMVFLDLRDNSLLYLKTYAFQPLNHLQTLLLSSNRILTIQKQAFTGLTSLRQLSLAHNYLYKVSKGSFLGLKALEVLDLSHNRLFSYNKQDLSAPFTYLLSLRTLDLSSQDPKPPIELPVNFFQGLPKLQNLSLRENPSSAFFNLSLAPLAGLQFLDLSDIYPKRGDPFCLHSELFQGLGHLRWLRMDGSSLRDLPLDIFSGMESLEGLSVRENKLRNLSQALLGNLTMLRYLDVFNNPLACSCENAWFQNWSVSDPDVQIPLLGSYTCLGPGLSEMGFEKMDLTFCRVDIAIFFFLVAFFATLLTMLGSVAKAKMGWTLRHSFYLVWAWGRGRLQRHRQAYQYDAYISCCTQDEPWVVEKLLVELEEGQPQYQLCFGPRDFAPGAYYLDNVQNGISSSRKTLCMVSRNYLESEWCSLEMQLACSRTYYQGHDPLVVVFLEEIPNYRLTPYHRLRKLLKQNSYLHWPEEPNAEDMFWTQLREALDAGGSTNKLHQFNVIE
ncbi:toll-like receptor 13 [Alligator mississippiensis]|nr:toll-like receptor 13 [Alligator mississippiensis]